MAEASVKILQEMNPLVSVSALTGTPESILTKDGVSNYTVVLLVGQPANIIQQADVVCTEAGIPLYAAVSRGLFGWAFANLHKHQYNLEVISYVYGAIYVKGLIIGSIFLFGCSGKRSKRMDPFKRQSRNIFLILCLGNRLYLQK